MNIDLDKPLYAKDKDTGKIHPVCSINFPLLSPSGKDLTVCIGDDCEWRAFNDIELMPQNFIPRR